MSTSNDESNIKIQLAEVVGEIRNLANSLNHYTEAQERHREEIKERFDKQEANNEKRFEKIELTLASQGVEISNIKEQSAGEAKILEVIQESNKANKNLAYTIVGSVVAAIIIGVGSLAFKYSGGG